MRLMRLMRRTRRLRLTRGLLVAHHQVRKGSSQVTFHYQAGEIDRGGIGLETEHVLGPAFVVDHAESRADPGGSEPLGEEVGRQSAATGIIDRKVDE